METQSRSQVTGVVLFWVFVGLMGGPPRSPAQEVKLPEEIRQALEGNAKALSPLTVKWERVTTSDFPEKELLAKLRYQPEDRYLLAPIGSKFEWQEGKFRGLHSSSSPRLKKAGDNWVIDPKAPLGEVKQEISFDGQMLYNGSPAGSQPIVTIDRIEKVASTLPGVPMTRQGYLHNAGFRLPDLPAEVRDKRPAGSMLLSQISEGAKVVRVGPGRVDRVSTVAVDLQQGDWGFRYFLDPAMGYAVRRREQRMKSGELVVVTDCTEFTKLPKSGLWLPKRVEVMWHMRPENPELYTEKKLVVETHNVSELSDDPIPESEFVLNYEKPGSFIADGRIPAAERAPNGRIEYQQPANPSDLDEVIKAAQKGYTPASRWSGLRLLLAVNVALIVAAVIFLVWKRRAA